MAEEIITGVRRPKLWRWLVGTVAIFLGWQLLGLFLTIGSANFFGYDVDLLFSTESSDLELVRQQAPWSTATTLLISFLPLFVLTMIAYRFLLRLPLRQLFTFHSRYSWHRTWIGFATFSAMLLISGGLDLILNPSSYEWSWRASAFFPYLVVCLTLLPIQTTAEELFFRGWLQQWIDNGKRRVWSISIIGGLLFAAPHLANPEVSGNDLYFPILSYGATGFMLSWVTWRDRCLEVAIGAHFANNLLAGIFISTEDSALPSASLFTTPEIAWGASAVVSIVMVPVFIWLTGKWNAKVAL